MEKEGSMITDWLNKYGSKDIEEKVNKEFQSMEIVNVLIQRIKKYCEDNKLYFVEYYKYGFIAYSIVNSQEKLSSEIKNTDSKRVYRHYLCYKDGDIVDNGVLKYKS